MELQASISLIEKEWELSTGFLGNLREGVFEPEGLERLLGLLEAVDVEEVTVLDRRFVSLTWYIPLFMSWQIERVKKRGGDIKQLDKGITRVTNILERILGVP